MSRPVDSTSGGSASLRAAEEAARRAAEAAARRAAEAAAQKAAAEQAARAQNAASAKPQGAPPPASRDGFSARSTAANQVRLDGAPPSPGPANAANASPVPEKAKDLGTLFPQLKDKPKEELEKLHKSMQKLVTGDFPAQAAALGELSKQFPEAKNALLDKLGLKDQKLVKLATDPTALKSLGTLTDPKATVAQKAQAALELANSAGTAFKPDDLKGVLKNVLDGLPAGAKLAEAIGTFTDPEATGTAKAKATLELAKSLQEFAGEAFPGLANDLRKLDGPLRAVSSAITLLDPSSSAKDKAVAAAQLATEIPDLKADLTGFKEALKQFKVRGAVQAVDEGALLAESAVKGLSPALASQMSPAQLTKLEELAKKTGPDELEGVLKGIRTPEALEGLVGKLDALDGDASKRLLKSLGGMEHGALGKVLSEPGMLDQLGTLATKLDDESAELVGKLAKDMDADGLKMLLKFTDGVDAGLLKTGLKGLGPLLEEGGGKLVGKGLQLMDGMLGKMGVEITADVAGKVFKNLAKAIPLAGAVPGVVDAVDYAQKASELHGKNKDLGFLAMVGAGLNGADAVVGTVLDFTGVGAAVDLGVGAGFALAELALDIGFSAEKAKFDKDPKNYQAPDWVKTVNLAAAASMGPSGMASLAAYYGPEGAAELMQWGVEKGAKGAVALAKFAGVESANLTGDGLHATAGFIHKLADVVRNPSKYGEAIATQARDAFNTALEKGGEIAAEAKKVLGSVIDDAKKLGEKGLETLKFIAQNPGKAAEMAVDGIQGMLASGTELLKKGGEALLKKAGETLEGLQKGWESLQGAAREKAAQLIESAKAGLESVVNKAKELGEKGLETLVWAASHPGEVAGMAQKVLTDTLAQGGELAKKAWEGIKSLGAQGLEFAESTIKGLQAAGGKAVETLKYIAENPGEAATKVRDWAGQTLSNMVRAGGQMAQDAAIAIKDFVDRRVDWAKTFATDLLKDGVGAFKEVAKAWGENLTEGGKEILAALKDLSSAGVDALKDLASVGGQLAETAVGYLGDLAKMGVDTAKGALDGLVQLGGQVGELAENTFDAVKNATNGEVNVLGWEVDVNPLW
ncbi:Dauer Up-regulated [Stigmatella erecta]|uniref:Dauer Up-regulated n=1 Tax=Stigmatella erecta TaxID=83460 RepID=A0A1I0ILM5_9BACT|nr:Dauer Up-regulated [Stigmatella erecta]SET97970.1 hypothetical protein SAMN05443639_106144 [Stigmatella erecta]